MKVIKFEEKFSKFSLLEKKKYIESLLKEYQLKLVLDSLFYNHPDIFEDFSIINAISKNKSFKNKYKLSNTKLLSFMINSLIEQNKTKDLAEYFNQMDEKNLKIIIQYEIENKTVFSRMKLCKDLYNKHILSHQDKKVLLENTMVLDSNKIKNKNKKNKESIKDKKNDSKENKKGNSKKKNILKKEIKSKKVKWSIGTLIILFICTIGYILTGYVASILLFYNTHIYPNIYLDGKLIDGETHLNIEKYLSDKEKKLNQRINLKNENNVYPYTYLDIGVTLNKEELENKLINDYKNLSGFQKAKEIFFSPELKYQTIYKLDEEKYNKFLSELSHKVNVAKTKEKFSIVSGKINYTKGVNGFTLDTKNLDKLILDSVLKDTKEIILDGKLEEVDNSLSVINKKVGTFTTYYKESQGRSRNIKNAVSKLDGTILYPNGIFSFYKTAGPYNKNNGYIFYDKDVGSGVCQVSTTIYNVQLLLNLPTVTRSNHGEMVYYVDYGMDATVYGSNVDYKFKNNSKYPIYLEASAKNGTLTVSFWSNENIVEKGYSYKPRVEKLGSLSYKTYLDTYYNGKFQKTVYLNSSYYSKGKH